MITLINAPSILGLRHTGVEYLPDALADAGLVAQLGLENKPQQIVAVVPPPYSAQRDEATHMLNPRGIAEYSMTLADTVEEVLSTGYFPVVLGGDCSILLGHMLALKRKGRYGLFFLDGHADFYQPEASVRGEAADMDLALVSGRGPDIVTDIEGQRPLVRDEDIVQFGQRDIRETIEYDSQQIADTDIHVFDLATIREAGSEKSCEVALGTLLQRPIDGFWIHVDTDVLSDDENPAVDYRQPGGLSFSELKKVLQILLRSPKAVGLGLTCFNPSLDTKGEIARKLAGLLGEVLTDHR